MIYDIPASLQAVFNAIGGFFTLKSEQIKGQATKEIITAKKNYQRACNIAEKIIALAEKYKLQFSVRDRRYFDRLVKKFDKAD